ncbi:MAG: hypothetical protein JWP07_1750 [Pseudonocardiales bacterium]|nr:hypothetical protein [Pseudonocardiales bacterium]
MGCNESMLPQLATDSVERFRSAAMSSIAVTPPQVLIRSVASDVAADGRDARSCSLCVPATKTSRVAIAVTPGHATTVSHERPPYAWDTKPAAHQEDVPTSGTDTQNVFLCRRQFADLPMSGSPRSTADADLWMTTSARIRKASDFVSCFVLSRVPARAVMSTCGTGHALRRWLG